MIMSMIYTAYLLIQRSECLSMYFVHFDYLNKVMYVHLKYVFCALKTKMRVLILDFLRQRRTVYRENGFAIREVRQAPLDTVRRWLARTIEN